MEAIEAALDAAHLTNEPVRQFVIEWAIHTGADRVEVVSAGDDDRLIREAMAAGELFPVQGERYYARSFAKDTARTEERTFVATSNSADEGAFNHWVKTSEIKP